MSDDSQFEECDFSGLPRMFCSHCTGAVEEKPPVYASADEPQEYEIIAVFEAKFPGVCNMDRDHKVKRGTRVARIQRADNPMLPISGVACSDCMKMLDHA